MLATQAWLPGDIPRLHSRSRQLTPESRPLTSAGTLWQACTPAHTCTSHPRSNTRITRVCTHTWTQTLINNFTALKRKLLLESPFSVLLGGHWEVRVWDRMFILWFVFWGVSRMLSPAAYTKGGNSSTYYHLSAFQDIITTSQPLYLFATALCHPYLIIRFLFIPALYLM